MRDFTHKQPNVQNIHKQIVRCGNTGHQDHCVRLCKACATTPVHMDYEVIGATRGVQCTTGATCQAGISLGQQKAKSER